VQGASQPGAPTSPPQEAPQAPIADARGLAPDSPGVYEAQVLPHHANAADQLFAHEASLDALAEVGVAKVAATRAQNAAVKQFASRMLDEHTKSREMIAAIGGANNAQVVSSLDPAHQRALEELTKLEGAAFDLTYIRGEVSEHQRTAQLYEWIICSGQDPSVTGYAMEVLPAVLRQLEMAQSVLGQLGTED
jgi:putative membrane protein